MGVLRFVWIAEGRAWVDIGEWNGRVMAVFRFVDFRQIWGELG